MPLAITIGKDASIYAAINALVPGAAEVIGLP
jgi:hypothetical protein